MKRLYNIGTIVLLLICSSLVKGQQNHSMYLMHYLPESNLLNPAVPLSCPWYIGLPVVSSVHFNYGNSSFSYRNAFSKNGSGSYTATPDKFVNGLHWRNYLGLELHTQLLAIGHKRGDYSFIFTATEKVNLPITYPKQVAELGWEGNTQFEGQTISTRGTALMLNHYREYAISVSKSEKDGLYYGVRAKLLFGKLNSSPRSMKASLYTDENTFNLQTEANLEMHSSLPIIIDTSNNSISGVSYDNSVSASQLLLNRKNPGFALDFGIIYPYSDKLELSASVLDLGFIRWRSNLNTIISEAEFDFEGSVTNSGVAGFGDLRNEMIDSLSLQVSQQKYGTFLPPRFMAGANYSVSDKLKTGIQGQGIWYKTKFIPSLTLSANYNVFRNSYVMASYTLQYYTFRNLGLGIVLGRNPVQFYVISDNVAGFFWPLSSRNFNARFGVNINLGCRVKKEKKNGRGAIRGNCYYLEKSIQKNYKKMQNKKSKR